MPTGELLPAAGRVRTVLGDAPSIALGRVNYHEHLFQASPLLPGDDLDDETLSGAELGRLAESGFECMVDATPVGLGRRPDALARVSAVSGVRVIATTGRHRDAHYPEQQWILDASADEWAAITLRELTVGQALDDSAYGRLPLDDVATAQAPDGTDVRAGMLKAAIDYWAISRGERAALEGVAASHVATGAPIMVHTESCSAALDVITLLESYGVRPARVVIAHADRTPDPHLHAEIAATGASVGYDGAGRLRLWPDAVLIDALAALVESGHADRVLLGADVARASRYESYGGMPGLAYLGRRFVPRLQRRLGDRVVRGILVDNPGRFLEWQN